MRKLLLLFVLAISMSNLVYSQTGTDWKWLHPSPQGNQLRAIQAFSGSTWYIAGLAGTFMKTTDAGATWEFHHQAGLPFATSGQTSNAYDIHFFDLNNGLICGSTTGILKTTDAGATWTPVPTGLALTTITFYQFHFTSSTVGYAAGSSGRLVKTTNGGASWDSVGTGVTTTLNDVWASDDGQTIMLATTAGNVRRTTDGGTTWATVNTGASYIVQKIAVNGTNVLVGGSAASSVTQVRLSTDLGATWTLVNTGITANSVVWDIDYTNGAWFVTGNSFDIFKSTDNGTSWTAISVLNPTQPWTSAYYAAAFSPTGDSLVAVGGFGLIQSKYGAAATPTAHTFLAKPGTWYDTWSSGPNGTVIAVGAPTVANSSFDQIARSTNGGTTWALVPFSTTSTATFWSIDMVDNNLGFTSGTNSAIYKTTNGGASWDSLASTGLPVGATFRKIDFVDANTGWVFVSAPSTLTNFIYKTTDGGATWTAQSHGISAASAGQVYGAHMRDANKGVLLTWEPVPYSTVDGGATWRRDTTKDDFGGFLYDVKMVDDSLGYMVGSSGRVYKTTNGGIMWDTLTVPTRSYTFNSLELINAQTVAIFGSTGTNFITYDGGLTWVSKNTSAATIQGSHWSYDAGSNTWALFAVGTNGAMLKNILSIVPVELAAFSAIVTGNDVNLSWTTVTELNNQGFQIERLDANGSWTNVAFIKGNGTSTRMHEYSFTDKGVKEGRYTYRLKQIDFDGTVDYSNLVEVEVGTPMTFALDQNYPNPFNPSTTISYRIPEAAAVTLKIFDVTGTEVATIVNTKQDAGSYTVNFDMTNFASGMYIYKIEAGKYSAVKKMMLMK
ncbi:MAG: hypothetical protein HBSAPP04_23990 [Ignavibacteriaceae bacterium]|nr:MAG: T9SS C-terminal target domain-containing protein [Chlorobiota bacterium]GJQ33560.1 MAG: hypothetical protein HBSAPP04_23990 [Ignavibacteriaceae bacterium]